MAMAGNFRHTSKNWQLIESLPAFTSQNASSVCARYYTLEILLTSKCNRFQLKTHAICFILAFWQHAMSTDRSCIWCQCIWRWWLDDGDLPHHDHQHHPPTIIRRTEITSCMTFNNGASRQTTRTEERRTDRIRRACITWPQSVETSQSTLHESRRQNDRKPHATRITFPVLRPNQCGHYDCRSWQAVIASTNQASRARSSSLRAVTVAVRVGLTVNVPPPSTTTWSAGLHKTWRVLAYTWGSYV